MSSASSVDILTAVQFSVNWRVPWSVFSGTNGTSSKAIGKTFVTSYNNVSLRWQANMYCEKWLYNPMERFFPSYEDGPMEKIKAMTYSIAVVKPDQTTSVAKIRPNYDAIRSKKKGWVGFEGSDGSTFRHMYGLKESDPLIFRIVLNIPVSAFLYKIENPLPTTTSPHWLVDLFKVLDDPQRSAHSNAKLISRDGHQFYCHKVISFQSAALDAMFRHPPGKNKPENEYEFPGLGKASLKSFIQFLYTGQADLGNLSTAELIELADGAEQYDLKPLKQACASVLWDRVPQDPSSCFQVIRLGGLHDDMKYLKYRGMDVLADNWEMANADTQNANHFGEEEEEKKLRDEFLWFVCSRVLMS